ncbi:MAG: hypothetical protein LUQ30_05465, partial [Methanothrix sp.]|nr:hypothetical protein [Methanothrix sp.]
MFSPIQVDKKIALEYYNTMAGDGDLELDSEHLYSQNPEKIAREIDAVNNGEKSGLNLIETTKMTYAGNTPLVGGKLLNSKAFYGGIGAQVQEMFSVYEMEKDQTSFFASTTPYNPIDKCKECKGKLRECKEDCACKFKNDPVKLAECEAKCEKCNDCERECKKDHGQDKECNDCEKPKEHGPKDLKPEDLIGQLEEAGRNGEKVNELMTAKGDIYVPSHVLGIDVKSSFNG